MKENWPRIQFRDLLIECRDDGVWVQKPDGEWLKIKPVKKAMKIQTSRVYFQQ